MGTSMTCTLVRVLKRIARRGRRLCPDCVFLAPHPAYIIKRCVACEAHGAK